jgi:hypothetical protein
MSQKLNPNKPLNQLFIERVIWCEAVQRERARAIKTDLIEVRNGVERRRKVVNEELVAFFKNGRIPGTTTTNEFRWSMDGFRPPRLYPDVRPGPISPALQRAWSAALEQWVLLIRELREGKWIATGNGVPEGGRRGKIALEQLARDGLWYDVRLNAVFGTIHRGWLGSELVRLVDTITVQAAAESEAAQPGEEVAAQEAAGKSSEAAARSPLRWPQQSDEMKPTPRQQIAFSILEADNRFSQCRTATEILGVMSLAKMERLLIGKKWPKNSHGQPAEGGPLQRDALKDALYKFFPDDP